MTDVLHCADYLEMAQNELDNAAANASSVDLTKGIRANLPAVLAATMNALNAHTYALMALTVGTRTEP